MIDPAMAIVEKGLTKILNTPGMEVSAVAVKLATEVMDRSGFPRASKVELEQVEAKITEEEGRAIVLIVRRACELAGLDLTEGAARSAVGKALREWADKKRRGEEATNP
jgi:hypothetical protein